MEHAMIPREDRALATLRAVYRFGKRHPRWPDAIALRRDAPKLGCRATIQTTLAWLRSTGLVILTGHGNSARWEPTEQGFDRLKKPAFRPTLATRHDRAAAASILAQPIRHSAVIADFAAQRALSTNLEVAE